MLKRYYPTINLRRKSILFAFALAALLLVLLPVFGIVLHLHFFVPALVISVYQRQLSYCLWLGILAGILTGLFAGPEGIGIYSLAYVCSVLCIAYYRQFFFADSISTLPVLTAISSCVATIVIALTIVLLNKGLSLSIKLLFYDAVLMSLGDGLYAFILYTLPAVITHHYVSRRQVE